MTEHPRRHDVWGDDPDERDASETIAEVASLEPDLARRWHDRAAIAPFKVVARFVRKSGKRIAVTIAGFVVVLIGIALIPLPGPGWAIVFAGLAILATEYVWAQRLLSYAKRKALSAKDRVLRKDRAPR